MDNTEVLNEVHKGSKIGMNSIELVSDKINDKDLKKLLDSQYKEYKTIFEKSGKILEGRGIKPEEIPATLKAMNWIGIEANTLMDKSNSQISDLLIQGTNMGVIKGVQLLNNTHNIDDNVKNLISDFVRLQERNIDDLKKFL